MEPPFLADQCANNERSSRVVEALTPVHFRWAPVTLAQLLDAIT